MHTIKESRDPKTPNIVRSESTRLIFEHCYFICLCVFVAFSTSFSLQSFNHSGFTVIFRFLNMCSHIKAFNRTIWFIIFFHCCVYAVFFLSFCRTKKKKYNLTFDMRWCNRNEINAFDGVGSTTTHVPIAIIRHSSRWRSKKNSLNWCTQRCDSSGRSMCNPHNMYERVSRCCRAVFVHRCCKCHVDREKKGVAIEMWHEWKLMRMPSKCFKWNRFAWYRKQYAYWLLSVQPSS